MDLSPEPKRLHALLQTLCLDIPIGLPNPLISHVTSDSRCIREGSLFVGLPGVHVDGGTFWHKALEDGAVAAVITPSSAKPYSPGPDDPVIFIPEGIETFAGELASVFWERPSSKIALIGVTGTNGKTTTTHLIEHLSKSLGKPSALFGTLVNRWPSKTSIATHTTACADILQAHLAEAVRSGAELGAMEVSSHALSQQRVAGCRFTGAVFTNLTQDHLDYHNSMQAYYEAKAMLFNYPLLKEGKNRAIVNVDNPWGVKLANDLGDICLRSSLNQKMFDAGKADLSISDISINSKGTKGKVRTPYGDGLFVSPLIGSFNLMNLLQAIGVLLQQGMPLKDLLGSIESFPGVPGRMERVKCAGSQEELELIPSVLIDYAHTPDGLKNALIALRELNTGKLICVFGCGGDRDRVKRGQMGSIAEEFADRIFLTSDNPRTEDPYQILKDVRSGICSSKNVTVDVDRKSAIFNAIAEADTNDVVLIAGKGHEDYQIIGSTRFPFDDREQAHQALKNRLRR